MATVPNTADELEFPQSWIFDEDGDQVAGTYVRFDRGQTKEFGSKVIVVLNVDGAERSIWLTQTAVYSKFRQELENRSSQTLEPGERVFIRRGEKVKGKNDREYWAFVVAFPDRPELSARDLFELDPGLVKKEEKKEPTEPGSGDVGPDGDIPF